MSEFSGLEWTRLSQNVGPFNQVEAVDGKILRLPKIREAIGDAGYRSPYFSHAKRALYHLSYIPSNVLRLPVLK